MPNSVKKVLRNTKLTGIHNTIGNILSTDPEYVKALNTAISYNKNFIITKDENSAKNAISYLINERAIYHTGDGFLDLEPAVFDNIDEKLQNLHIIYADALAYMNMNDYSQLDIRYKNRIFATKKE